MKRYRRLVAGASNLLRAGIVWASGGDAGLDLAAVVPELLALELDGVFRNVVSFL